MVRGWRQAADLGGPEAGPATRYHGPTVIETRRRTAPCPSWTSRRRASAAAGRATRRRDRRCAPRRVPAGGPGAAAVLRLDARLPDEPQRLRGDGRPPARRGLRRGAVDGDGRPRRDQHAARSARRAEQKVIGRQGHLAKLKRANPGLRVVLTGCSVREPDRAGCAAAIPAVDLFLRPDEEPELVDRLGLASAPGADRARRHGGPRSSAGRRSWRRPTAAGDTAPRPSRAATVAPRAPRSAPGCRSSTAATRRAPTASSRSAAARSGAARSTRSSTRRARSRRRATARSRSSARTSTRTATTCAPEARFGHVDTERWAGRRLDLARPAGPRRAHPRDRRPAHRRRPPGDPAPAVRHLAPVGPLGPADRGDGRLPSRSASTSTCRSSRATTRSCGGWAGSTRSSTTSSGSRGSARRSRDRDQHRRDRRVLRRDRGPVRVDARGSSSAVRYDQVFAAAFSPRPGTPATHLADDVPPDDKRRRLNALLALQEAIGLERNRAWLGRDGRGPRRHDRAAARPRPRRRRRGGARPERLAADRDPPGQSSPRRWLASELRTSCRPGSSGAPELVGARSAARRTRMPAPYARRVRSRA